MNEISPEVLKRYAEGGCTAQERAAVEAWLENDDELGRVDKDAAAWSVDVTADMDGIKTEILEGLAGQIADRKSKRTLLKIGIYGLAAACVLVVCGVFLFGRGAGDGTGPAGPALAWKRIDVPAGKRATVTLSEGTVVQLSGRSSLVYPAVFAVERDVKLLSGEAFFAVHHDGSRPFTVHSSGTEVRVLGTKFNVDNRPDDRELRVTLTEGRISFKGNGQLEQVLRPGQQLVFDKTSRATVRVTDVDTANVTGWTSGLLCFKATPMTEVFEQLEVRYGVSFKVRGNADLRAPLTGRFSQQPLSRVLKLIEYSSDLKFRLEGRQVLVY